MDCIYLDDSNKSISKIEYIDNFRLAPKCYDDKDAYRITISTNKVPVCMYATSGESKSMLISNFLQCINCKSDSEFTLVNNVLPEERYMYKIHGFLRNPLAKYAKSYKLKLNIKYEPLIKDGKIKYVRIIPTIKYNIFLIWYKTFIQPEEMVMPIDHIEDTIYLLSGMLHIN